MGLGRHLGDLTTNRGRCRPWRGSPIDPDFRGLYGNRRGRYTERVQQRIVLSSRNFFAAHLLLLQNFGTQLGRPGTRTQTKHMPVSPAGRGVVSADSPGKAEFGSTYSLRSKDGGGSESWSMSFTCPDLRGSRAKKDNGGLFTKRKILEVSVEFRVEVRWSFHKNTGFLLYMVFSPNSLLSI